MRNEEPKILIDETNLTIVLKEKVTDVTVGKFLSQIGIAIDFPCAGRGRCGNCAVTLSNEKNAKKVLACEYVLTEADFAQNEVKITIEKNKILNLEPEKHKAQSTKHKARQLSTEQKAQKKEHRSFFAVDIGTTTVEVALVSNNKIIDTKSVLNPQKAYGADVISRISYCENDEKLLELSSVIRKCINSFVSYYKGTGYDIEKIVIAGNTTMLHLLANVSPKAIGVFPFKPEFTETKIFKGEEIGVEGNKVILLPSCDGYIGADIVSGVYASGIYKDANNLLLDLGTNGEMVISYLDNGIIKMKATSSAAGPCLEGANISSGMGGQDGAISKLWEKNGTIFFETISDKKPAGLCGAGLVDLVATLVQNGTIDESGFMEEDFEISGIQVFSDKRPSMPPFETGVTLTRKDVRELQLAKAAIRAGIDTLIEKAELNVNSINKIIVSGGLGQHINPVSCKKIGLIPDVPEEKLVAMGNTALSGAIFAGSDESAFSKIKSIAKEIEAFSLNEEKGFSERYIDNMHFL